VLTKANVYLEGNGAKYDVIREEKRLACWEANELQHNVIITKCYTLDSTTMQQQCYTSLARNTPTKASALLFKNIKQPW